MIGIFDSVHLVWSCTIFFSYDRRLFQSLALGYGASSRLEPTAIYWLVLIFLYVFCIEFAWKCRFCSTHIFFKSILYEIFLRPWECSDSGLTQWACANLLQCNHTFYYEIGIKNIIKFTQSNGILRIFIDLPFSILIIRNLV